MAFRYSVEQYEAWKAQILDLLTRSGPLSVSDVWLGLKGKISDVMARRTLEQLVAEGRATVEVVTRLEHAGGRMTRVRGRVYSAKPAKGKVPKRRERSPR